ncbi:PBECR4 domain-containing protein [Anaerovibrio sp.]|uniref:PBECR4 domain-containing protein n=1 Tax=Anaerovibrio sp. TaxID=1872532 RepID=UPI003F14B8D7
MDLLYEAASWYKELLKKDYHVKAAYKNEVIELSFMFLPEHFYHLIGFQKLLDMKHLAMPKFLYTRVISGKLMYDSIKNSKFLGDMYDRMQMFYRVNKTIEHMKNGEIIIEFSQNNRTCIKAEFLLYDLLDGSYAHIFLRKADKYGYVPCSFFCRKDDKYIRNNKKYRIKEFYVTCRKDKNISK